MAVVGRQVRVAASEDAVIAVQRDVVVDPQSGRAIEVERIAVAVDAGDGNIAVAEQQRIVGVATQPQCRPAIRAAPSYGTAPRPPQHEDGDKACWLLFLCLLGIVCFPIAIPICLLYCCCIAIVGDN